MILTYARMPEPAFLSKRIFDYEEADLRIKLTQANCGNYRINTSLQWERVFTACKPDFFYLWHEPNSTFRTDCFVPDSTPFRDSFYTETKHFSAWNCSWHKTFSSSFEQCYTNESVHAKDFENRFSHSPKWYQTADDCTIYDGYQWRCLFGCYNRRS